MGIAEENIYVAPNTLHVPNSSFDQGIQRHTFLFVGRLQRRKQIVELLEAFAIAEPKLPLDCRIDIVGEGEQMEEIRKSATGLGIQDRVACLGRVVDPERLKTIFQRALAYVCPGAVGLGVLHSFAYGIPVITSRHGNHGPAVNDITDGKSGFLYTGGREGLSARLIELATNPSLSYRAGRVGFDLFRDSRTVEHMAEGFVRAIGMSVDEEGG